MVAEVVELVTAMSWKPWKHAGPESKERILDELADVLAFLGNLVVYVAKETGCTADEIALAYARKANVNVQRAQGQVEGYGYPSPPPQDDATKLSLVEEVAQLRELARAKEVANVIATRARQNINAWPWDNTVS